MSVHVGWRVTDASAFAKHFPGDSIALAQRQLGGMLYGADTEVVGQHSLSDFVNPDGSEAALSKIEKELQSVIEGKLDKNSGIGIESLGISSVTHR
jgi:regulator of protease activity HflC (stomatin/prohibitin superfamily)